MNGLDLGILIKNSKLGEEGFMYVKVIKSGDTYEIYKYEREPSPIKRGTRKKSLTNGYRRAARRTPLNAERTRKTFIRIVRSNLSRDERPTLITLTMRDIVSIDVAYSCLTAFHNNLRAKFGKGFRYVAVPEFQKRGAVHFHILYWGLPVEVIEHERTNRTIQNIWALGYVDCLLTDGSQKLAGYLAKYMSKSMQDDRIAGQKAYACSRNVLRPMSFSGSELFKVPDDFWDGDKVSLTKRSFHGAGVLLFN